MQPSFSSTALIGIEVGLLKGLDTMKWVLESIKQFVEASAISTIVQCNASNDFFREAEQEKGRKITG